MIVPAETERLSFRDWIAVDLEALYAICSDPCVMEFVGNSELWSW